MGMASGNRVQRVKVAEKLKVSQPQKIQVDSGEKQNIVDDLGRAV
jgi:hypothetical protein